jgi:synaptic vesicle membrane protein VAT-1
MKPRRVVFARHGEVDVLALESFEPSAPSPTQIAIDVAYAGVNYADVLARRGFYKWAPPLPTCVGFEVSGTVSAIGTDVREHRIGDRVAAVVRFGGYADRVLVDAPRAWKLPDSMPLEHGAAIPAVYLTAWQSLFEVARVRAGETLLTQAVAGGVGLAALQLAKNAGLSVLGTASRPDKLEFARQHGLDHGIDYAREDFATAVLRITNGRGVDVVLDSLGGEGLRKGYRCLARGGRLVTIGAAQVAPTSKADVIGLLRAGLELVRGGVFHPFQLIEDNRAIAGVQVLLLWDDLPRLDRGMHHLFMQYEAGIIRPSIDDIVGLPDAGRAHQRLQSRASRGKLLLRCAHAG